METTTTSNPTQTPQLTWHHYAALILVVLAFVMSAFVSRHVFERLPHLEDEVAYLYQAKIFAGGQIVIDIPEPRRAYWQPFVVDYLESGKRFGKYTPGWPAILAIGVSMGQAWLINALFAALTVALTYRLGREIFNPDVGIIAALLVTFSPAALLLNASLMGHTAALCYTTTFIYAYWRIQRSQRRAWVWGLLAGAALGMMVITRPLSAIAIALPFIIWSGLRLIAPLFVDDRPKPAKNDETRPALIKLMLTTLTPLLALSAVTLIISAALPAFNYAATGDAGQNLYELVWHYDRVGFGECCGRSGHTLEKAVRHARFDLSLTAADLYGWQIGDQPTADLAQHFQTSSSYYPNTGFSFVLIPFGLLLGVLWGTQTTTAAIRRLVLLAIWLMGAGLWVWLVRNVEADLLQEPAFAWLWIALALVWAFAPLLILVTLKRQSSVAYAWLLAAVVMSVLLVQMTYWIGSQRYSTRYYFEALTAVSLISALPLAWLARRAGHWLVYPVLILALLYGYATYSVPRLNALYRFNMVGQHVIDAVNERRPSDQPVLVIVNGPNWGDDRVRWRAMGTLMALTSPYFDSDIALAWDYDIENNDTVRDDILARHPDYAILEADARGNDLTWRD